MYGSFKNDKPHGLFATWYSNGQRQSKATWVNGRIVSAVAWKPNGEKPETNIINSGVAIIYNHDGTVNSGWLTPPLTHPFIV